MEQIDSLEIAIKYINENFNLNIVDKSSAIFLKRPAKELIFSRSLGNFLEQFTKGDSAIWSNPTLFIPSESEVVYIC